jgi:hypothetical protein
MSAPRRARTRSPWAGCMIGLAVAGCTGVVSSPGQQNTSGTNVTGAAGSTGAMIGTAGTTGTSTGAAGTGTSTTCNAAAPDPGDAPLTRLTQPQYLNTINDLFGKIDLTSVYPATQGASQFGLAQADVDGADLDNYERAAEVVSAAVVASTSTMTQVAPCATGATTAAARTCATQFLQGFATRIYRSPVAAADMDRHLALYDAGAANGGYAHGIQLLLEAMLQSSRFLYRVELGTSTAVGPTAVQLSDYELASRLSYGLWNTTPDVTLNAAAAAGKLETPADVTAQLQRMLQDPRGATMVPQFLGSWIALPQLGGVAKAAAVYPQWTPALQAAMVTQAQSFFTDLLTNQGGTLKALLTSQTVFTNNATAALSGATASALPSDGSFQSSQNPAAAGLLTLPAFLATQAKADQSSPIYRCKFVCEQFFCQELPSPPANIPPAPVITPGVSTRERLAEHEVNATCAACHSMMDPIGFGFENYDGVGAYRTMDNGKPVDASGMLTGTDVDGAFTGVAQLGALIANSATAEACVGKQWFRYAMGRAEQVADTCSLQQMSKTFHASGADLRTLPAAIVQTPAFMYRRPLAQGSN